MPEQIHDKGYKRILSKKKNFLSLLKTFINTEWMNDITEDDLELINSEFIPKDFKEKKSDIIYKVRIKDTEVIFYFLLELQSSVDYTICIRLLAYIFELYKRLFLNVDENTRERTGFRLPAIIPCVLYNGINTWTAVRSFKEYLSGYELFTDNIIDFKYILLNVNQYSDETLIEIGNLISSIFTLDKKQNINTLKTRFEQLSKIFINLSADEKIDLMDWIKDVLMKKVNDEKVEIVKQAVSDLTKGDANNMTYAIERLFDEIEEKAAIKGKLEGKLEGKREGKIEGRLESAKAALKLGLTTEQVSKITSLTIDEIEKIIGEV